MIGQPDKDLAKKHKVEAVSIMSTVTTKQLERLGKLVDSGKVKFRIAKTFSFPEASDAFKYFETEHPHGKVVLSM